MARARNIKPAFFTNDELADIEPLGRLLFIGLWTLADCNGNVEWREKRIKAQLLPYDDCDVKQVMINLDKYGFVRFYSDGKSVYFNITNFDKHQNPHKNERDKGSEIPEYNDSMRQIVDLKELTINRDLSGLKPDDDGSNPADSLNLIPLTLNPIKEVVESEASTPAIDKQAVKEGFDHFWKTWLDCKKLMGVKNISPKTETFDKKWKPMFNESFWRKHGHDGFDEEVNAICEHAKYIHDPSDEFCPARNLMTGKFFSRKGWKDE